MDLTLNADQRDLRSGLRGYLTDVWTPDRLRSAADDPALDRKAWRGLAEMGVFGLTVPESGGGMGLGLADAAIVFEELGRALVPGPLVATFLAAGLVPDAEDGGAVVTMLDAGEPIAIVEHLPSATQVVVVADDGLFLLPADGLAATPTAIPLDPLTPVSQVMAAPEAYAGAERVGSAGDAVRWRLCGAALTAALQVGVAQGGLDLAVRYAKERTQFDRPIGSFQAVKHLLAESLVRVDLARAAVLVAALTIDDPRAGDPEEAVSAAKILADDAATAGGRTCVQVHGGMGFTWEVLAHLYLKRAWLLETCFGRSDEHAMRLATILARDTGEPG
ncbi:acyl-CoA dehydrogenase family protein [Actinomadura scrupuli]|uniref:acyl-CoA dehydrogenase family protein n=1 Tax=Actinomadura scrupuli TaxID=559629 RepID=UPI003D96A1D8